MVNRLWAVVAVLLFFSGCSTPVDYETVWDELGEQPMQEAVQVFVTLPADETMVVLENEAGKTWLCGDYAVCLQTLASGDLSKTMKTVTGLDARELSTVRLQQEDHVRYEFTWVCAGEGGDQVNRAVLLDDGHHHYVLTLHGEADSYAQVCEVWAQIIDRFSLRTAP